MPALVTRNWSDNQYRRGVSARITFIVTGVSDEDAAVAAVPFQKGSTHPRDSRLIAEEPELSGQPGPSYYPISVQFMRTENGMVSGGGDVEPIDEPPTIFWEPGTDYETIYRDVYGNPIVNGAGFPFEPQQGPITSLFLTVERNESSFDPAVSLGYMNHINEDSFEIDCGNGIKRGVEPGQCYCHFIGPTSPYNLTATYLRIRYRFELRDYFPGIESPQRSAFQLLLRNQGRQGWYYDTENEVYLPGNFTSTDPEKIISDDILLDEVGNPLDSRYKVEGQAADSPYTTAPAGADAVESDSGAWYFIYDRIPTRPFSGLNL